MSPYHSIPVLALVTWCDDLVDHTPMYSQYCSIPAPIPTSISLHPCKLEPALTGFDSGQGDRRDFFELAHKTEEFILQVLQSFLVVLPTGATYNEIFGTY